MKALLLLPTLLLACTEGGQVDCSTVSYPIPTGRGEVEAVWDDAAQRMVFFGGNLGVPVNCSFGATEFTDELWAYNTACDNFERIEVESGPAARGRHAVALDEARQRMIITGGRTRAGTSGPYQVFADTWAFDLATDTWTELAANGPMGGRFNHSAVVAGDKMVVFGGNNASDGAMITPHNDTWVFDLTTDTWSQLATNTPPPARLYHAAATDGDFLYVYAGGDANAFFGTFFRDLWALDLASGEWTMLHDGVSTPAPLGRMWGALEFDDLTGELVMFGGHDDGQLGNANDTWTFDLTSRQWTQLSTGDVWNRPANDVCDFPADFTLVDEDVPDRRNAMATAYTPAGEWLVFGGKTDCGNINDVWSYSGGSWAVRSWATEGEACLRSGDANCESLCY